jgi:hypothetical protein
MVTTPAGTEGGKDSWWKIGTAFLNRTGDGYSILMGALPIPQNGRIRMMLMDPNRFGDRRGAPQTTRDQQSWQRPPPRRPMPIDQGPPAPPPNNGEDPWS